MRQLAEHIKATTEATTGDRPSESNQRLNFKRKPDAPLEAPTQIKRQKTVEPFKLISEELEVNIFPLKTPAQDRLRLLQQKCITNKNDGIVVGKEETESFKNEDKNEVLQVIRRGFGIYAEGEINTEDLKNIKTDEENKINLRDNGITHIVPDTNVFLRSLACIQHNILQGELGIAKTFELNIHAISCFYFYFKT